MRYTISSQQLSHFRRERFLELDGLFSEEEASLLKMCLDEALAKEPSGRDLERDDAKLKKALHLSRIGQVASAIFGKKRLKLAFTQYPSPWSFAKLEEVSCITELPGGALIDLVTGQVTFYPADQPIVFESITHPYLIIGLSFENGRYKLQESDPHTHRLKKRGYAFGDTLKNDTHPLIVK